MAFAILIAAVIAVGADPAPAVPSAPAVHRLSPDEVDAAIDAGATRNRAAEALAMNPAESAPGRVHGEFGFGVGTGGAREVYGAAAVPLGDRGTAAFDFNWSQFNPRLGYRRN